MCLILIARERELAETVSWQFRSHPEIEVVNGDFEKLEFFDCIATARNSFGLMDAVHHERIHYGGKSGYENKRPSV